MSHNIPRNDPSDPTEAHSGKSNQNEQRYILYTIWYTKSDDDPTRVVGFTTDERFYERCRKIGMEDDVPRDMRTPTALSDEKKKITDEAYSKIGNPNLFGAISKFKPEDESLFWWVSAKGVRTDMADMSQMQDADADRSLGLKEAYERLLLKAIKRGVQSTPYSSFMNSESQLRQDLEALGAKLTIEDINALKPPADGKDHLRQRIVPLLKIVAENLTPEEQKYLDDSFILWLKRAGGDLTEEQVEFATEHLRDDQLEKLLGPNNDNASQEDSDIEPEDEWLQNVIKRSHDDDSSEEEGRVSQWKPRWRRPSAQ